MEAVGRIRPFTGDDLLGRIRFQWTTGLTVSTALTKPNGFLHRIVISYVLCGAFYDDISTSEYIMSNVTMNGK
jgi:hypothetical protein